MRTLALLLTAGVLSLAGTSSTDISSLFPNNITSTSTVIQCQATGAIDYYTDTRLSPLKINEMNDFKQRLKENYKLPLDKENETIKDSDGKDIRFHYKVTCNLESATVDNSNFIRLTISFDNFYSWAKYHELQLGKSTGDESLFFIEYTTKFNPYDRYYSETGTSGKTAAIINEFNNTFDESAIKRPGYLYVLTNSARRTQTNADKTETEAGNYTYYFKIASDLKSEVNIFDRYPNTPIWYGLAAAATVLAMIGFYLFARRKHEKITN
jgi:hypothetical protein